MAEEKISKPKIIYIDDEKENLIGFKYMFREYYDINIAESAAEGYEIIKELDIKIVISDQRMPVETGVELFSRLKDEFPDSFRMILTGYSDIEAIIDAINKGHVYYYFKKPWNEEEVRVVINHALESIDLKERLREKEELLRSIFETAEVGIASVTPNGQFLFMNNKLCGMLGYTRKELLDLSVAAITHPDDMTPDSSEAQSYLRGVLTSLKAEKRYRRKDGSYMWGNMTLSASREKMTAAKHMIAIFEDISERKVAEQALIASEAKYVDLYENSPDMHVSVDAASARILECNQTLASNTGYLKEEIVGSLIFDMYHPDCMEAVKEAFRAFVRDGEVRETELQLKRKDGGIIDVSLNVSAFRDKTGKILYSRSSWRDISKRKQAEKKIMELNEKLEERVEQRTAELKQTNLELTKNMEEIKLFNKLAIGREKQMVKLKEEINELLGQQGREKKYKIAEF